MRDADELSFEAKPPQSRSLRHPDPVGVGVGSDSDAAAKDGDGMLAHPRKVSRKRRFAARAKEGILGGEIGAIEFVVGEYYGNGTSDYERYLFSVSVLIASRSRHSARASREKGRWQIQDGNHIFHFDGASLTFWKFFLRGTRARSGGTPEERPKAVFPRVLTNFLPSPCHGAW